MPAVARQYDTVCLLETEADVARALPAGTAIPGQVLPVALGPVALEALRARGIAHVLIDDYASFAELDRWLAGRRDLLPRFCEALDGKLGEMRPAFRAEGLRAAGAYRYYFKYTIEPALIAGYKLERLLARVRPRRLVGYRNPVTPVSQFLDSGLWPAAALAVAGQYPGLMVEVADQPEAAAAVRPPEGAAAGHREKGRPSRRLLLAGQGRALYRLAIDLVFGLADRMGRKRTAVLVADGWAIPGIVSGLPRRRFRVIELPAGLRVGEFSEPCTALTAAQGAALDAALADPAAAAYFTVGGHSVLPAVRPALELFLANVDELHALYGAMCRVLQANAVEVVLTPTFSLGSGIYAPLLVLAARRAGCRTVSFQHGAEGVYPRATALQLMDLEWTDNFIVWGEAVRRNLRTVYGDDKYVVAGNLLQVTRPSVPPAAGGKPRVLFVPREFRLYHPLDSWDDPVWSYAANHYWLFVRKNLDLLLDCPGIELTVKLYPHELADLVGMVRRHCAARGGAVTVIRAERNFQELLAEADVVVLDFLGTPFCQAVQTDAEIFVYTHARFTPECERAAEGCAHYHRTFAGFRQAFTDYLQRREKKRRDGVFVREYLRDNRLDHGAIHRVLTGRTKERET